MIGADASHPSATIPLKSAAVIAFIVLTIGACSSASGEAVVPEPSSSAPGAALYASNCASCHGADLGGTDQGPSHLSRVYEPNHHGDEAFRSAIANGSPQHHWSFGDMPAILGLDDADVDAIIDYVRAEQERRGFDP